VARALGYRYLDSGALYRAVTWALLQEGVPEEKWAGLSGSDLEALGIRVVPGPATLEIHFRDSILEGELRGGSVTELVPRVARIPAVREWLLGAQRSAAREGRLVADGRDMGTVVFPQARVKVILEADLGERARRRLGDKGGGKPTSGEVEAEAERLAARDRQDRERDVAPLRRPDGALLVDTTHLTFRQQVDRIAKYAREAAGDPRPPGVDA
jgi:cytidylate kinase